MLSTLQPTCSYVCDTAGHISWSEFTAALGVPSAAVAAPPAAESSAFSPAGAPLLEESRTTGELSGAAQALESRSGSAPVFKALHDAIKARRHAFGQVLCGDIDAFQLFDQNGDGELTAAELGGALSRLDLGLEPHQLEAVMAAADTDNSGTIDLAEFMAALQSSHEKSPRAHHHASTGSHFVEGGDRFV